MTAKIGFSIRSLATYEWPVTVKLPANGVFQEHQFTGVFRHLSSVEGAALAQRIADTAREQAKAIDSGEGAGAEVSQLGIAGIMVQAQIETYMELWCGWKEDLQDLDGVPLPYSEETKRQLLSQRVIREAIAAAHKEAQGGEAVRTKNSSLSPEAGHQAGES